MKNKFLQKVNSRFIFNSFLFFKVPASFFAGLKIISADEDSASVMVKYKWFNRNPFKSIYFAVLAMAAELSTGILSMNAVDGISPRVSLLVIKMNADFKKKAVSKITFTCNDGRKIMAAVHKAVQLQTGQSVEVFANGIDSEGDVVAEFKFTWTFKQKIRV